MSIWDLAKPVIAQVHGYCLAGASELATGCDLVYMAEDAQMGYPAVRFGVPDMHFHAWFLGMRKAMEMMLTGDSITGRRRRSSSAGPTTRSRPTSSTSACSRSPAGSRWCRPSCSQLNKRVVHRQMDVMGMRAGHSCRHRALRARDAHQGDARVHRRTRARRGSPTRCRNATLRSATTARPRLTERHRETCGQVAVSDPSPERQRFRTDTAGRRLVALMCAADCSTVARDPVAGA